MDALEAFVVVQQLREIGGLSIRWEQRAEGGPVWVRAWDQKAGNREYLVIDQRLWPKARDEIVANRVRTIASA